MKEDEKEHNMMEEKIRPPVRGGNTRAALYSNVSDSDEGSESEGSCDFPDY